MASTMRFQGRSEGMTRREIQAGINEGTNLLRDAAKHLAEGNVGASVRSKIAAHMTFTGLLRNKEQLTPEERDVSRKGLQDSRTEIGHVLVYWSGTD